MWVLIVALGIDVRVCPVRFRAQLLISLPVNRAPHWWVFKLLRLGSTNVCALVDYIITSSFLFMSCPAFKKIFTL